MISYEALLDIFWRSHNAFGRSWSTQYQAVLWTHGPGQADIARASAASWGKAKDSEVQTPMRPATRFWIAEDYHQKYYLRSRGQLLKALVGANATEDEIRESTIAARANGWITGHGKAAEIAREAEVLGIDAKAGALLNEALDQRVPALCR